MIKKNNVSSFLNDYPSLGLIAFSTPRDQPGSLLSVLDVFKSKHINLTKILTRPEKSKIGTYVFLLSF